MFPRTSKNTSLKKRGRAAQVSEDHGQWHIGGKIGGRFMKQPAGQQGWSMAEHTGEQPDPS